MSSIFDRDDVNKAIGLAASCLYRLRAVEARANKSGAKICSWYSDVFVSLPTSVGFLFAEKALLTGKRISLMFACSVE